MSRMKGFPGYKSNEGEVPRKMGCHNAGLCKDSVLMLSNKASPTKDDF